MPETEADRILRERIRQQEAAQQEQKRIAAEAAARQLEADNQRFLGELRTKMPAILNLISQTKGYGAEAIEIVVKVRVLGVFFRREPRIGAGWFICTWSHSYFSTGNRDDSGGTTVRTYYHLYLLSDGSLHITTRTRPHPRFESGKRSLSAEQLWTQLQRSDDDPNIVLMGLDNLQTLLTNAP